MRTKRDGKTLSLTINGKNSIIFLGYVLGNGHFRKELMMINHVYEVMETAKPYTKNEKNEKKQNVNQKGNEFTYEIKKHIGVLRTSAGGWTKELNIVSWNGNSQKYDLREWSEDHKKMSRGITLTISEARDLFDWLCEEDFAEQEGEEE